MPVEIHQMFPEDLDAIISFSQTKPILVDYRDRQHFYIFCTQNMDIDAGQYGTLHLQASVWNELPIEQGTRLQPVGLNASAPNLFVVITRASNKLYAAIPVLQFDISNISHSQAGVLIGPIGVPFYKLAAVQLTGVWTGTVTFEQSINGVTYAPTAVRAIGDTTQTLVNSVTGNGFWRVPLIGRYFQVNNSVLSSGTITASTIFFMNSVDI